MGASIFLMISLVLMVVPLDDSQGTTCPGYAGIL